MSVLRTKIKKLLCLTEWAKRILHTVFTQQNMLVWAAEVKRLFHYIPKFKLKSILPFSRDLQYVGKQFASSMKLAFHTSMLVASGMAFYKTQSLDINKHPVPWLNDVLLYICVPAFFVESILTVIPTITTLNIVQFLDTIIMVSKRWFLIDRRLFMVKYGKVTQHCLS
jgi:hypothetical protein